MDLSRVFSGNGRRATRATRAARGKRVSPYNAGPRHPWLGFVLAVAVSITGMAPAFGEEQPPEDPGVIVQSGDDPADAADALTDDDAGDIDADDSDTSVDVTDEADTSDQDELITSDATGDDKSDDVDTADEEKSSAGEPEIKKSDAGAIGTLDEPIFAPLLAGTGYNWWGDANQANAKYIDVSAAGGRAWTSSSPQALNGAIFVAVRSTGNTPPAVPSAPLDPDSHYWCTTGGTNPQGGTFSAGDCRIRVANGAGTWWVLEYQAPAGYTPLRTVALGYVSTSGSSTGNTSPYDYAFRASFSGNSGQTVSLPGTSTDDTNTNVPQVSNSNSAYRARFGEWAHVADNGSFPAQCGVRIAMVFDVSASVDASELTQLRNAAKSFISMNGGLGGTGSEVALFRFAETAAQVGSSRHSIATASGIASASTAIDGISASGIGQYTNWDHALRTVAASNLGTFDVVLVLTDGDPTASRNNANSSTQGQTTDVTMRNIEQAVFSANLVKSQLGPANQKTFILPVGVGMDSDSLHNLNAISAVGSPRTVANFPALQAELVELANENCGGTLTVVKKTLNADGTVADETADGWTFTGLTAGTHIIDGSSNVSSKAYVTGSGFSEGTVNFRIDLSDATSRSVNVKETVDLTQWNPVSVTCSNATYSGTAADFNVTVERNKIATCTVTNRRLPPTQLTLIKQFTGTAYGPHIAADWNLTATAGSTVINFNSGDTKSVAANTAYTIGETPKAGYELVSVTCTGGTFDQAGKRITVASSTTASCIVTNRSLPAKLQILKQDTAGNPLAGATFQLWRESNGTGALETGVGGDTLVHGSLSAGTANVNDLAWGTYHVRETVAPPGYEIATPDTQTITLGAAQTGTAGVVTFQNRRVYQDLTVSKTVTPSFDRDYDWSITKTVDRDSARVIPGQNAAFAYTVTVTSTPAQDANFVVSGVITVVNANTDAIPLTGVTDSITGIDGEQCSFLDSTTPVVPGREPGGSNGTATIRYTCALPAGTTISASGSNTATVTWNKDAFYGTTGSASTAAMPFSFANVQPTNVTDASVTVSDTATQFGIAYPGANATVTAAQASAGKVFTYIRNIGADVAAGECRDYDNTASIPATTDQGMLSGRADVTVCAGQDLTIDKHVITSLKRTYDWSIAKSVDHTTLVVDDEGNATFHYTVTATPGDFSDSEWAMSGTIEVRNPNAWDVTVTVTDVPSFSGSCLVTGGTNAIVLAGQTKTFSYTCTITNPASLDGSNTATVIWNPAEAFSSSQSASDVEPITADDWNKSYVNSTIAVIDDKTDPANPVTLGTATWTDARTPVVFSYSLTLSGVPAGECKDFTNTAWIETLGAQESVTVTICDYQDLTVTKTANPAFNRAYSFTIDKVAQQTQLTAGADGTATASYTVTVTDGALTDSSFAVAGVITASNPNNVAVTLTGVSDLIGATTCTATLPTNPVVPAKGSLDIPYSCGLTGVTATSTGTNTASVTWSATDLPGTSGTAQGVKDFDFAEASITDINAKTITVVDDKTVPTSAVTLGTHTWSALNASGSFEYDLVLQGTANTCVDHTNTAMIQQTQQQASEEVTVCAYGGLGLDITVTPAFDRDYDWTIAKLVDRTAATVLPGGAAAFEYTVRVTPTAAIDSAFTATGSGSVSNPNDVPVTLTSMALTATGADAVCSFDTAPTLTIPAQGTVPFTFSCTVPAGTATTSLQVTLNIAWASGGPLGDAGSDSDSDTKSFSSVTPTTTDATATVSDNAPEFGADKTVNAVDGVTEYTYTRILGTSAGACQTHPNTATVDPSHSDPTSADRSVTVCAPIGTIDKTVSSVSANADGTWTVVYDLVVTNPSTTGVAFEYQLRDIFDFGDGFSAVAASAAVVTTPAGVTARADWNGGAQPIVVDAANLPANAAGTATHSYTLQVRVAYDDDTIDPGLVCQTGESGAFLNGAQILVGQTVIDEDDACAQPATPTFTKTATSTTATQTASGDWLVSYQLRVTNPTFGTGSAQSLFYALTDVAGASLTGGVSLVGDGWSISGPGASATWNGIGDTTITAGAVIGADEQTRVYTVTGTVRVAPTVPASQLTCDPQGQSGSGIVNTATLTHQFGEIPGRACVDITPPTVDLDKTVTSTDQLADGSWEIVYEIEVDNSSALAAVYSLTDVLSFGGDITVTGATWGLEGADPAVGGDFSGTGATLATGKTLAAGATDTYTVTVIASLDDGAWEGDTLVCDGSENPGAGGFLNTATVTVAGTSKTADDCSEPASPTVTKTGTSVTQDDADPDTWLVAYEIQVTGPAGSDTYYTLEDTPGFAAGVTLGDGTAQRTDIAGQPVIGITPGGQFPASAVLLEADAVHTWTVTWEATIAATVTPPADECSQEPTAGEGFYNLVELLQGGVVVDDDDACLPVTERVYPTFDKTVTSLGQNTDGSWTIVYELEASLAANDSGQTAKYDLDDTLDFGGGIAISSATWAGPGVSTPQAFNPGTTLVLADDRIIPPGTSHVYTVTVIASVPASVIGSDAALCVGGKEPTAGGFLNTATLSSGGQDIDRAACAEPAHPEIEKTGTGSTHNPDSTWDISYEIVVSYPDIDVWPMPTPIVFTLTDAPSLPAGVALADGTTWTVTGVDGAPVDQATFDGTGTWKIAAGQLVFDPEAGTLPSHTYLVSATVAVSAAPVGEPVVCEDTEATGILVLNEATIMSGAYRADDDGCNVVHYDDVSLVKSSQLPEGQGSVEPGDEFDYVLTVTNHGTRVATGVRVVDADIDERLEITGVTVLPTGLSWTPAPGFSAAPNLVDLTIAELGVGETAEVVVSVRFLPYAPPAVADAGSGVPEPADPVELLSNTACVSADLDQVADNNCDREDIPARDITAVVYTVCVADAPLLGWHVKKSQSLIDEPITFLWVPDFAHAGTDPESVTEAQAGGMLEWEGMIAWPGTDFTPSGVSVDYPGWRPLQASDYAPGGGYFIPGTTTVMTPAQELSHVFSGLILDDSELDYAWRLPTTVTFSVNPELVFSATYPGVTTDCAAARHSELEITKTASVSRTEPGGSFEYGILVENVSDDAAADGVVVTDVIPADLRVTDVSWAGEGDASVFPNWQVCEVAGQDGAGYGGTLTCRLHGPLQPQGDHGGSIAPQITLSVAVDPTTKAISITNTAVVDYHTFGDPDDTGRDMDDVTVDVALLAVTGGDAPVGPAVLGLLMLLTGAWLVVARRRRHETAARH